MTSEFDPNGVGVANGNLWALPFDEHTAKLVIIPLPWDVTTSFKPGTHNGPGAVLAASPQIDIYDPESENTWRKGIALDSGQMRFSVIRPEDASLRKQAELVISHLESGSTHASDEVLHALLWVNQVSTERTTWLQNRAKELLQKDKIVAVLGGDHSTPLGLLRALGERFSNFGVLHIDAHLDLREAYEGFNESHASIMWNARHIPSISKFVHVGIRDMSAVEAGLVASSGDAHEMYTDRHSFAARAVGKAWLEIATEIVKKLPDNVYISFDIDGLKPELCPNTGTPVPGGLEFEEALLLVDMVRRLNKTIIGFDLVEVAPATTDPDTWVGDWNANVGMRILYRLACATLK